MPDQPESLGEVARLLRALQDQYKALHDQIDRQSEQQQARTDKQFDAMNTRLDNLVSEKVFQASVLNTSHRIDELAKALNTEKENRKVALADERAARQRAIDDERVARKDAIVTEIQARKDDIAEEKGEREKTVANYRNWVRGLAFILVTAIVGGLTGLIANAGG